VCQKRKTAEIENHCFAIGRFWGKKGSPRSESRGDDPIVRKLTKKGVANRLVQRVAETKFTAKKTLRDWVNKCSKKSPRGKSNRGQRNALKPQKDHPISNPQVTSSKKGGIPLRLKSGGVSAYINKVIAAIEEIVRFTSASNRLNYRAGKELGWSGERGGRLGRIKTGQPLSCSTTAAEDSEAGAWRGTTSKLLSAKTRD